MGPVAVLAGATGFGGMFAVLVGVFALRQKRRLSRTGVRVAALVKLRTERRGEGRERPLIQLVTEDDRVMELVCPVPSNRRQPFHDGDSVLVAYDPTDPRSVVVPGRERSAWDLVFIAGGVVITLLSAGLVGVALVSG